MISTSVEPTQAFRAGSERTVAAAAEKLNELRRTGNRKLAVRNVVVHIALSGVRLAPRVFVRRDVLRFGVIGRTRVQRRVQIVYLGQNSVRRSGVRVSGVAVRAASPNRPADTRR